MNLALRYHTSDDYASLPNMADATVGVLGSEDQSCLNELGKCLLNSRSNKRFGISLLHSHFCTSDKEVFVQTSDAGQRIVSLRPMPMDSYLERHLAAINVRFNSTTEMNDVELIGLEYLLEEGPLRINPIGADDANVLRSLQNVLEEHSRIERFGVRIIHYPVELAANEVYSETCDLERRILTCEVLNRNDPLLARSIDTFWVWASKSDSTDDYLVNAHCPANCVIRCRDDLPGHPQSNHKREGCN